jgi:hypothetical protein
VREREGEGERGTGRSAGTPLGKGCRCTRPASPPFSKARRYPFSCPQAP